MNLIAFDKQIQTNLAHRALIRPQTGKILLEHFVNDDAAVGGAKLQQVMAILDDGRERGGLLVQLVTAGFDARQVQNLVDEAEQVHAGIMNVG